MLHEESMLPSGKFAEKSEEPSPFLVLLLVLVNSHYLGFVAFFRICCAFSTKLMKQIPKKRCEKLNGKYQEPISPPIYKSLSVQWSNLSGTRRITHSDGGHNKGLNSEKWLQRSNLWDKTTGQQKPRTLLDGPVRIPMTKVVNGFMPIIYTAKPRC